MNTRKATLRLDDNIWGWVSSKKNEGQSDTSFLTHVLNRAYNKTQDPDGSSLTPYDLELEDLNKINKKLMSSIRKLNKELNKVNKKEPLSDINKSQQPDEGCKLLKDKESSVNAQFLELNNELMDCEKDKNDLIDRIKYLIDIETEVKEKIFELEIKIKEALESNSLLINDLSLMTSKKEEIEDELKSSISKTLAVADSLHKANDENTTLKNNIKTLIVDIDSKKEEMLKLSETVDRLSIYNEVSDNESKELSEKIISVDVLNKKLSSEVSSFEKKIGNLKKEIEDNNKNNIQLSLERDESKQSLQKNMDAQERLDLMSERFKSMKDGFKKMRASRDLVKSQMKLDKSSVEALGKIERSKNKKNIFTLSGIIIILIMFSGYCFLKGV